MKYSVLIATIGSNDYLRAIRSVVSSERTDYEIVLVLDKVALKEVKIRENFNETDNKKIKIISNSQNIGLTKSLNKGLEFCNGDIICRLDDDDVFQTDRFEILDKEYSKDIDIVTGGAAVEDEYGNQYFLTIPQAEEEIIEGLKRRNILVHSSLNIKKKLLMELGGYDERFKYAQDYELYLRLISEGARFSGVETLCRRYEGKDSITVNRRSNQALFSLAAICLYYANNYEQIKVGRRVIIKSFARFLVPSVLRKAVRALRGFKNKVGYK